ncbi:dephospho-CoA kinase [Pontibacter cellulosilyticus]|uniref:Dephospho-CoA kinase n=1 Tax=Pontibacter cellulosilyticus TaxID=1720253 RepID=A0A923N9M3_9BACT|nr:dephospho-CoA kinase [Pontibacter cellulosilyticus]MBC5994244.1 dephospho-CoA kinase [Pontibacter cellulosilyticus]
MLKVGITGGIGVGKTVVARMFSLLGIPVYDSDGRAKWVMQHDQALKSELTGAFGPKAFTEKGDLDRAYIASIVFNNPERLQQLNSLVHPHVRNDFAAWVAQHTDKPYIIKEAALMYESEAWKQIDKMITVYAPTDVRIKRLLLRDTHRTEADIKAIIGKQLSEEEKMARADYVITNNDQEMIIPQVLALHEQLLKLAPAY